MIEMKPNYYTHIICILGCVIGIININRDYIANEITKSSFYFYLILFMLVLLLFFVTLFARRVFDKKGVKGFSILSLNAKDIDRIKYIVTWDKVEHISSYIFPLWMPFKNITINFNYKNNHPTFLPFTNLESNFKDALIFLSDHVPASKIDEDVLELIEHYKKQKLANK